MLFSPSFSNLSPSPGYSPLLWFSLHVLRASRRRAPPRHWEISDKMRTGPLSSLLPPCFVSLSGVAAKPSTSFIFLTWIPYLFIHFVFVTLFYTFSYYFEVLEICFNYSFALVVDFVCVVLFRWNVSNHRHHIFFSN